MGRRLCFGLWQANLSLRDMAEDEGKVEGTDRAPLADQYSATQMVFDS